MSMRLKSFPFNQTDHSVFENVFKLEDLLLNHVIIEPGQIFSKHPTDADVYAIIVKGMLSIAIGEEAVETYASGQVVYIPKGYVSELGNRGDNLVELFVIKTEL